MTASSSLQCASGLCALMLAASVTLLSFGSFGCTAARPHDGPAGAGSIFSPPGAVATALIEPGEPKPLRTYGPDNHTWPEIRTSVGHTAHRGSDNVLCRDCHAKDGFKHEGNGGCGREDCHKTEASHPHGVVDRVANSGCVSCHSFRPGVVRKTCVECHKDPQTRAGGAKLAAVVDGHAKAECGKCHQPHKEPLSFASDCTSCHVERSDAHATHKDSKGCSDCHAAHSPAKAATKTCSAGGCHATPAGPKPAGHESCLTCHKGHATDKPLSCNGCHVKQVTLASDKVAKHAQCTSCHAAHAPGETTNTCQKCHAKVSVGHAKAGSSKGTAATPAIYASKGVTSVNACGACHAAHPKDSAQKPASCSTCHAAISKTELGAHASNLTCASCHAKHALKAPAKAAVPAMCGSCHPTEVKRVGANKGHADCTTCHTGSTHALKAAAGCSTCHTVEQASAPKGHDKCSECHETHGGTLTPKSTCTTCHTDRTKGPHRDVKGSCQTCHRAHGPKGIASPPACTSCHAQEKLPGLHVKHKDCSKCHTAHGWVNSSRESCTSCHTKQKTHEKTAKTCTGCHVFIRP